MYAKNIQFTSSFLCRSLLRGKQKKPFVSPRFLHTLFLENEEKTSKKKNINNNNNKEMFSYPFVAHMPKIRQI